MAYHSKTEVEDVSCSCIILLYSFIRGLFNYVLNMTYYIGRMM
jgi:hypothetical protein